MATNEQQNRIKRKKEIQSNENPSIAATPSTSSTSSSSSSFGFNVKSLGNLLSQDLTQIDSLGKKYESQFLSGVKSIIQGSNTAGIGGGSTDNHQQSQQKNMKLLADIVKKFRIQTPESHLGLALAYSESLLTPVMQSDLEFTWYRSSSSSCGHSPSTTTDGTLIPLSHLTSTLNPNHAWYPPCADDIGHVLTVKCTDVCGYGLSRQLSTKIITVDPDVSNKVEEAIRKDRILAKVIISSSSTPSQVQRPHSEKPINCSESSEFEIVGSIEIGSKGILLCEKGIDYGGLRFHPSSEIQVVCCQPSSFILRAPLREYQRERVVPGDDSIPTTTDTLHINPDPPNDTTQTQTQQSGGNTTINWVGSKEGDMCDALSDLLSVDYPIVSKALEKSKKSKSDEKTPLPPPPPYSEQPCTESNSIPYLELTISCRDRLIRDTLVLSIRSLSALVLDPNTSSSIETRIASLPWNQCSYQSLSSSITSVPSASPGTTPSLPSSNHEFISSLQSQLEILQNDNLQLKSENALLSSQLLNQELSNSQELKFTDWNLSHHPSNFHETSKSLKVENNLPSNRLTTSSTAESLTSVERAAATSTSAPLSTTSSTSPSSRTDNEEIIHLRQELERERMSHNELESRLSFFSTNEIISHLSREIDEFRSKYNDILQLYRESSTRRNELNKQSCLDVPRYGDENISIPPPPPVSTPVITDPENLEGITFPEDLEVTNESKRRSSHGSSDDDEEHRNLLAESGIVFPIIPLDTLDETTQQSSENEDADRIIDPSSTMAATATTTTSAITTGSSGCPSSIQIDSFDGIVTELIQILDSLVGYNLKIATHLAVPPPSNAAIVKLLSRQHSEYPNESINPEETCNSDQSTPRFHELSAIFCHIHSQLAWLSNHSSSPSSSSSSSLHSITFPSTTSTAGVMPMILKNSAQINPLSSTSSSPPPPPQFPEMMTTMITTAPVSCEDEINNWIDKVHKLQRKLDSSDHQKRQLIKQIDQIKQESFEKYSNLEFKYLQNQKEFFENSEKMEKMKILNNSLQDLISQQQEHNKQLLTEKTRLKVMYEELLLNRNELNERYEQLRQDMAVNQQSASGVKEMMMKVQHEYEKLIDNKHNLEQQLHQFQQQNQSYREKLEELTLRNTQLMAKNDEYCEESSALKEKLSGYESRLNNLQLETLELSDSKQTLLKQLNSNENNKRQSLQLRSQLIQLDQELLGTRQLYDEMRQENERMRRYQHDLEEELQKKQVLNEMTNEKITKYVKQIEEIENMKQQIEKDRISLRKENNKLRVTCQQLEKENVRLNEIEVMYTGQLEVLIRNHSKICELENQLQKMNKKNHEYVCEIMKLEMLLGQCWLRYERMIQQYHYTGMEREDLLIQMRDMRERVNEMRGRERKLQEELQLSKEADPFIVKKLNYMIAKLNGEKNHHENKAKSLSKDLQRKLLAGTPLQRELGRVTARLEELENERNAYRDAMMLACDAYAEKDDSYSWF